VPGITDNLDSIGEAIRQSFTDKDSAREQVLPLCRDVIRHSSKAIRAVHRQEFDAAKEILDSAEGLLSQAKKATSGHEELENTGFFRDAQKEYSEALITLALVTGSQVPSPKKLAVEYAPYLNGMGEAVGELRRFILDGIRREDFSRGEELLEAMDDIYSVLVTMDFPDAITGGLRRTTDMVRGVLEKTRSDLTLIMRQNKLETRLRLLEKECKQ
jgi:translin